VPNIGIVCPLAKIGMRVTDLACKRGDLDADICLQPPCGLGSAAAEQPVR
jgi:hypothetical protein